MQEDVVLSASWIEDLEKNGFVIIDNFLALPQALALHSRLQYHHNNNALQRAKTGVGQLHQLQDEIRRDLTLWLEGTDDVEGAYLQQMEQLRGQLNQAFFLGLAEIEAHFAIYPPGGFYKKHVDQFQQNQDRQLSVVFYLNQDWSEADGGQLVLYDNDVPFLEILPIFNRLILFRSHLPHEVKAASRTRCSIAGWFRRRSSALFC